MILGNFLPFRFLEVFFMRYLFLVFTALTSLCFASEELDIHIPVVDMRDFYNEDNKDQFYDTLYQAMTKVGFFAVRHTGVDRKVIQQAYDQAIAFFKQDSDYKAQCFLKEANGQRGFVPGERAKNNQAKDFKEFYHIGSDHASVPNIWPDQPGFQDALMALYSELEQYVIPLQQAIVELINRRAGSQISLDFLNKETKNGDSLLRALYYPATTEETNRVYWAAPHTDIDLLAILPFATEKGLQVEMDGQWFTVVVPEDAFIVNVGDMLANLTNGLFVSAKHRVVALEPNKERFSMVFFVHPMDDTPLDPLPACIELTGGVQQYAPGTRKEFLWERLLELNIAPGVLVPYSQTGHTERQIRYQRESKQVVEMLINHGLASPEVLHAVGR